MIPFFSLFTYHLQPLCVSADSIICIISATRTFAFIVWSWTCGWWWRLKATPTMDDDDDNVVVESHNNVYFDLSWLNWLQLQQNCTMMMISMQCWIENIEFWWDEARRRFLTTGNFSARIMSIMCCNQPWLDSLSRLTILKLIFYCVKWFRVAAHFFLSCCWLCMRCMMTSG
jgi:hypothetical protein